MLRNVNDIIVFLDTAANYIKPLKGTTTVILSPTDPAAGKSSPLKLQD
jgi:hypothetical protein